jgi:hypothetical protein
MADAAQSYNVFSKREEKSVLFWKNTFGLTQQQPRFFDVVKG